jgi:F0F1-type ATP synthase delta subunit
MVKLDKEQEKVFVNELMEANELKGASKKRLIKFLDAKYDWDKLRVQFRLTRTVIAERYAKSH